jgi:hypothetical protein
MTTEEDETMTTEATKTRAAEVAAHHEKMEKIWPSWWFDLIYRAQRMVGKPLPGWDAAEWIDQDPARVEMDDAGDYQITEVGRACLKCAAVRPGTSLYAASVELDENQGKAAYESEKRRSLRELIDLAEEDAAQLADGFKRCPGEEVPAILERLQVRLEALAAKLRDLTRAARELEKKAAIYAIRSHGRADRIDNGKQCLSCDRAVGSGDYVIDVVAYPPGIAGVICKDCGAEAGAAGKLAVWDPDGESWRGMIDHMEGTCDAC